MRVTGCALALLALGAVGCGGTTGGHLIQIPFEVGGIVRDVTAPFTIPKTGQGWTVTLTRAEVILGPLYFNIDAPQPSVFRSGVVIMQVTKQFIVDMLDPTLQTVSGGADGETGTAVSVEIGFYTTANSYNDKALDASADASAPFFADNQQGTAFLAGQASKGGAVIQFAGRVQITSALVSALNPIDQLARVAGACANPSRTDCALTFTPTSGPLELRVDPSNWFNQADFCNIVTPPPKPLVTDGGASTGGGPIDAGSPSDGSLSDGGPAGTPPTGASCAPVAGTVYGWSDTNPFNSALLTGMKASRGVYAFSLGQP